MTAQQEAATAVRRSITVAAPVEKAFDVFTDRFGAWWPLVRAHCRRCRGRLGRCAGVGAADAAGARLAT